MVCASYLEESPTGKIHVGQMLGLYNKSPGRLKLNIAHFNAEPFQLRKAPYRTSCAAGEIASGLESCELSQLAEGIRIVKTIDQAVVVDSKRN